MTISYSALDVAFSEAVWAQQYSTYQPALMGKMTGASSWTFDPDPSNPTAYKLVTVETGSGSTDTLALNLANVPSEDGLPIWIAKDLEGNVYITGVRSLNLDPTSVKFPVWPAYGALYCHEAASSQNFTTTPSKFTQFTTAGVSFGTTVSAASDSITVLTNGVYEVSFNMLATLTSGTRQDFHVRVDAVDTNYATGEYGNGSPENITLPPVPLELNANEEITIYGEAASGTQNCAARHAQLVVRKIAEL